MRQKTGQTFILVPATPVTRKAIGLSSTEWAAKFLGSITSGFFGCHQSWDSVLRKKWDLLPARSERELDTLIKSLKFNEHRDFLMSTIRCHQNACVVDMPSRITTENYLDIIWPSPPRIFFMTWNEQLELFAYDCLLFFDLFKLTVICRIRFTVWIMCFGLKNKPARQSCS